MEPLKAQMVMHIFPKKRHHPNKPAEAKVRILDISGIVNRGGQAWTPVEDRQ